MKKIMIAISVLLTVGAGALWFFLPNGRGVEPPQRIESSEKVVSVTSSPEKLSSNPVSAYWVGAGGSRIYYAGSDGSLFLLSGTVETKIDGVSIPRVSAFSLSASGEWIAAEFGEGTEKSVSLLHLEDRRWLPLEAGTVSFAWEPGRDRLAYLVEGDSGSPSALNILDLKTEKVARVFSLAQFDSLLSWPTPEEIYLGGRPTARYPSSLLALNLAKKTIRSVGGEESGFTVRWSRDGNEGLKFSISGAGGALSLVTRSIEFLKGAPFVTLPEKCAFGGNKKIYCAVPRSILPGTVLPDDYLMGRVQFEDDLIAWDLATDAVEIILSGDELIFDAEKLSATRDKIFFVNRYDHMLYTIPLQQ